VTISLYPRGPGYLLPQRRGKLFSNVLNICDLSWAKLILRSSESSSREQRGKRVGREEPMIKQTVSFHFLIWTPEFVCPLCRICQVWTVARACVQLEPACSRRDGNPLIPTAACHWEWLGWLQVLTDFGPHATVDSCAVSGWVRAPRKEAGAGIAGLGFSLGKD
jgi:hypothetical protein